MRNRDTDKPRPRSAPAKRSHRPPSEIYLSNLDGIKKTIETVASSFHLSHQDRDDFGGEVHLKMIEDNYAVLRRFGGMSQLTTYLFVVVRRAALDFLIRRFGKWRSSSAARGGGAILMELERLIYRDGMAFEEACTHLESLLGRPLDRERLAVLLARIPARPRRRETGVEALEEMPAPNGAADASVLDRERREAAPRVLACLKEALAGLSSEERYLFKLYYEQGLTMAQIARHLRTSQSSLYRQRDLCLEKIRRHPESRGIDKSCIDGLMGYLEEDIGPK